VLASTGVHWEPEFQHQPDRLDVPELGGVDHRAAVRGGQPVNQSGQLME
jgi:hypothetical protein